MARTPSSNKRSKTAGSGAPGSEAAADATAAKTPGAAAAASSNAVPAPLSLPVRREAAECLKALGHPVRLRMVELLLERELNVNELAGACRVPQPVASTHLRFLQRCRLFAAERRGKSVFYRVAEPGVADLLNLIRRRFSRRVSP